MQLSTLDPTASIYVHILHHYLLKIKRTTRRMMLPRAGRAASVSVFAKSIRSAGGVGVLRPEGEGREKQGKGRRIASLQKALEGLPQLEHDHLAGHTQQALAELCPRTFQHVSSLQQIP